MHDRCCSPAPARSPCGLQLGHPVVQAIGWCRDRQAVIPAALVSNTPAAMGSGTPSSSSSLSRAMPPASFAQRCAPALALGAMLLRLAGSTVRGGAHALRTSEARNSFAGGGRAAAMPANWRAPLGMPERSL